MKKENKEELKAMLETSRVTTQTEIPEEDYILTVDDVGTFARGDIHAIKAKQKSGKTTALKVILSALMGGNLFRLHSLLDSPNVIYFDTEQSLADTKQILKDVQKLTGLDSEYIDSHLSLYSLRRYSPDELKHLLTEAIDKNHPDVIFLDGLVEFVVSFNDETESKAVVQTLLVLAEKYHCAIIAVLHTNKAEDSHAMRGHLGSMTGQKAATVLECERTGDVITVKSTDVRHQAVPTWSIMYDEEGNIQDADTLMTMMIAQDKVRREQQRQEEANRKRLECLEACKRLIMEAGGSLIRKTLTEQMEQTMGIGHSKAYSFIKDELEKGTIKKENGCIMLPENPIQTV